MRRSCRCCETQGLMLISQSPDPMPRCMTAGIKIWLCGLDSSCKILVKFMGSKNKSNNSHCHFTGDSEYFTINTLLSFSKWCYTLMKVGNFHMSLGPLTLQEQGKQQCQLFWLSVREAISGRIQTTTSSGLLSTRTTKGRTGGVKCIVILPQNVFLVSSYLWFGEFLSNMPYVCS